MSFQFSHLLACFSALAYLAFCLLMATFSARQTWQRCSIAASLAEEDSRRLPRYALSCLVALLSFLFVPCGVLPSLVPIAGGAILVIGALMLAALLSHGWMGARLQVAAMLFSGAALAMIAHYAQQRGVPGDLYALDAYVALPLLRVAEGSEKIGLCVLAGLSLAFLWKSAPRTCSCLSEGREIEVTSIRAVADELWILAAISVWICLFFPFAWGLDPEFPLPGVALNALLFWGKVIGFRWLIKKTGR